MGRNYRVSSESAWPLRGADGKTFAERKQDEKGQEQQQELNKCQDQ